MTRRPNGRAGTAPRGRAGTAPHGNAGTGPPKSGCALWLLTAAFVLVGSVLIAYGTAGVWWEALT